MLEKSRPDLERLSSDLAALFPGANLFNDLGAGIAFSINRAHPSSDGLIAP